jgi:hypothetical protein
VVVGIAGVCGKKKEKNGKQERNSLFLRVYVLGAVGADVVGKVVGAAMGDQGGGCGCGTPVQKEKKKGKKKLTLFFWYPYQVLSVHTR